MKQIDPVEAAAEDGIAFRQSGTIDIDSPPAVFLRIASRIESFLRPLGRENIGPGVKSLEAGFSKRTTPRLNYDELARPFSYTYFIENFWKGCCAFLLEKPTLTHRIVDVGSGSGATLLAYLAWLDQAVSGSVLKVQVLLIDRSKTHLTLAMRLVEALQVEFENLIIFPKFECVDFLEWRGRGPLADTLLFGHVLNENRGEVRQFLEKAASVMSDNGRMFIIEREKDSVWGPIELFKARLAIPTKRSTVRLATPVVDSNQSERLSQKSHIVTDCLALYYPDQKYFVDSLRLYFEAWEKQSVSMLRDIFDPDAKYYEKPYERPLCGLDQIEDYWKNNVLRQQDIHPIINRVAYTHEDAFAEWTANFRTFQEQVEIKGVLILRFNRHTRRVKTLHEYFRTQKTYNDRYPHSR